MANSEHTQEAAASTLRIRVGVVVAREQIENIWEPFRWCPLEVHSDPPGTEGWVELRRLADATHFHTGRSEIVLYRNEVPGYIANLSSPSPCLYVILRETEDDAQPLEVHLVTPSNSEVQAYGESGAEVIGAVPMPPEIREVVSAFVDAHYQEEKFVKRKRQKFDDNERHVFGQEPIVELRKRMRAAGIEDTDEPL